MENKIRHETLKRQAEDILPQIKGKVARTHQKRLCEKDAEMATDMISLHQVYYPLVLPCNCSARYSPSSLIDWMRRTLHNPEEWRRRLINCLLHGKKYGLLPAKPVKCLGCQTEMYATETSNFLLDEKFYDRQASAVKTRAKSHISVFKNQRNHYERVFQNKPYLTCPFKCHQMVGHTMKDMIRHIFKCVKAPAVGCAFCHQPLPCLEGFSTYAPVNVVPLSTHVKVPLKHLIDSEQLSHLRHCPGLVECGGHQIPVAWIIAGIHLDNPYSRVLSTLSTPLRTVFPPPVAYPIPLIRVHHWKYSRFISSTFVGYDEHGQYQGGPAKLQYLGVPAWMSRVGAKQVVSKGTSQQYSDVIPIVSVTVAPF